MESEHETDSSAEHPVTIETGLKGEQRAAIINRVGLVLVIAFFAFKWALDRSSRQSLQYRWKLSSRLTHDVGLC